VKKTAILLMILITFINATGCSNTNKTSDSTISSSVTSKQEDKLSYDKYMELLSSVKDNMSFTSIPMKLTSSTLKNPSIIIVNGDMSFGKKKYLSLNNDFKDSTQYFLTYEDEKNSYKLITGWIYTDVDQGNNLLYFKPNEEGNTDDFNSILSYRNVLIHLQLISTAATNPSSEAFVKENESALKEIVDFLEKTNDIK